MNIDTAIDDAIELLRCAADGSYEPEDTDLPANTEAPSLLSAVRELLGADQDADSPAHKRYAGIVAHIAFEALNKVDEDYGAGFEDFEGSLEEGMRHAFLEAAVRLELELELTAAAPKHAELSVAQHDGIATIPPGQYAYTPNPDGTGTIVGGDHDGKIIAMMALPKLGETPVDPERAAFDAETARLHAEVGPSNLPGPGQPFGSPKYVAVAERIGAMPEDDGSHLEPSSDHFA